MAPWRIVVLAILLALTAGCAHRIDYGPRGPLHDPEEILDIVRSRYASVDSLRAEGRLGIESREGSGNLRMALEVQKPARIYLETADILGNPRGTFSTDGRSFVFYDPGEHLFYTGPATEALLGQFLPISLPPPEIASLLLGQPPLIEGGESRLEIEPEGVYRIEIRSGRVRQRIRVGTRDLRLISVETRGIPAVDVEALEHEIIAPDLPVPTAWELRERRTETIVRIRVGDAKWNVEAEEELFRLRPPPGARVERLDASVEGEDE